jgi:hypothetical protein
MRIFMNWWIWTSIAASILYAALTVFGILRCPILRAREKILLILFSIAIPILGAYFSNRRLNHKISESGRAALWLDLPFWVTLGMPINIGNGSSDVDTD